MGGGLERLPAEVAAVRDQLEALAVSVHERFEEVDARFEEVDARFDQVDTRFVQVDARFDQVDARFDQVDARFVQVDARLDQVDARFARLESRIEEESVSAAEAFAEQRAYTEFTVARLEARLSARLDDGLSEVNGRLARLERKLDQFIDAQLSRHPPGGEPTA